MITYGDMDDGTGSMPPDTKNLLINAHLKVGESQLMITDSPAYGQLTDKFGIMWHVNLQATE